MAAVIAVIISLVSCDTDINTVGGDLLGADQLGGLIQKQDFDVVAFNTTVNPVQTNNFRTIRFGTYFDPLYGTSEYEFVSQMSLPRANPDFGDNVVLNKVILDIPYFSRPVLETVDGTEYVLDSIYGNQNINIRIYENGYFLNSFDPQDLSSPATYFSDLYTEVDANKGVLIHSEDDFEVSALEVQTTIVNDEGEVEVTERFAPRIRIELEKTYWENTILNAPAANLESSNAFQNYFRGLLFQIEGFTGNGTLMDLDIANAVVELQITSEFDIDNDPTTADDPIDSSIELNFNGNRVNFITNNFNPGIIADIQAANDDVNGEERLYLKGGPGSIALIDLFGEDLDGNGEADALTQLIEDNPIVNEASLTFYVDQSLVEAGATEPERIMIYDYENNVLLADFALSDQISDLNNAGGHWGRLEREGDSETSAGVKYTLRLTEHINQIIAGNAENVRLAVAVTQNVTILTNSDVSDQTTPIPVESIPTGAAYAHEGTVLHGNLSNDPDKRLKLEVYYTPIND